MPGLLEEKPEVPEGMMYDSAQDSVVPEGGEQAGGIEKLKQSAEAKVPEQLKDSFNRVVVAGKKILYSDETHDLMKQALQQGSDPAAIGKGVAQLMGILSNESRNTIPEQVFGPAALTLLADVLDYVESTTQQPIGPEAIDVATQSFAGAMLKSAGVSKDMMGSMIGKTQELMSDPNNMSIAKQQLGDFDMSVFDGGEDGVA